MSIKKCKHCHQEFDTTDKPKSFMGSHSRWCHANPKRQEYIDFLKNENTNPFKYYNENKENHIKHSEKVKQAWKDGKYDSVDFGKGFRGKHLSDEHKLKVSEGRKKFLNENPEKHPWKKNSKFISVPCEKVKDLLRQNNIQFVEEFSPLENKHYSIDIAFPDLKLGIEINGNQHYDKYGNLTEYYQTRHDEIESTGWKLIELHYIKSFNMDVILKIIENKEQIDYSSYFSKRQLKQKSILEKNKIKELQILKDKELTEELISKVENSSIDFSKFGWVAEVSNLIGIRTQKVNKWMKTNMASFYKEKCFKRNKS